MPDTARLPLRIACGVGLALTLLPAIAYFLRWIDRPAMTAAMLVGLVLWFVPAVVLQRSGGR